MPSKRKRVRTGLGVIGVAAATALIGAGLTVPAFATEASTPPSSSRR